MATAEDILRLTGIPIIATSSSRENTEIACDFDARTSSRPREVLNDKKIEVLNDVSRLSEEKANKLTSSGLGGVTSFPNTSPEGLKENSQEAKGVVAAAAARTSSRNYQGISVQHARTQRGVKLFVTLQTPQDADQAVWTKLTAELKHPSRMREVRARAYDAEWFPEVIARVKQLAQDQKWHIGRLHLREKRSAWIPNCVVLGQQGTDAIERVKLILEDECYDIELTETLSNLQHEYYHSAGIWGTLIRTEPVHTLATLPRERATSRKKDD